MSRTKIVLWGIFFLILFLPLIYFPNTFNPFEFPKFITLIAVVQIWTLIYFLRPLTKKKEIDFPTDLLTILILCFGVWVLISDILGLDLRTSLLGSKYRDQGFVTLTSGILLYLLMRFLNKEYPMQLEQGVSLSILGSAFFVCFFVLWQAVSLNILNNYVLTFQGRIIGTFGNPNFLGGYLSIILPFILNYFRGSIPIRLSFISIVLFVIFLSGSRSALLASMTVLLLYALYTRILITKTTNLFKSFLVLIPLIILFGSISKTSFYSQLNFNRTSKFDNRLVIWSLGLKAIPNRLIMGYGQENFELIIPRRSKFDHAHNIFLETAISSGVIGLILYLLIILQALKKSNLIIKLSLIAFLITASFNPLSIAQIVLFWVLLGQTTATTDNKLVTPSE